MKINQCFSHFLLTLAALFAYSCSFAQYDTIFISHQTATYLLFDEPVALIDIGMAQEYYAKIEGNAVFLKATKQHARTTSLFVKSGERYVTAFLTYQPSPAQFLYDYRKEDTLTQSVKKDSLPHRKWNVQAIQKRLIEWNISAAGAKTKRVNKEGLSLSLTHIQNDKEATYLRLIFSNASSIDYQIDLVSIERKERKGKRFSSNNINSVFIDPAIAACVETIEATRTQEMRYAIPLYAMRAKDHLTITFREKNGSRILHLSIPARYITKASIYPSL